MINRLEGSVRALCSWSLSAASGEGGGLRKMAGAALRRVGATAALGQPFITGSPPLLLRLLQVPTP